MTEEYCRHLCDLLESYARPFRLREPVVCLDEKSGHQVEQACATARRIDLVLASLDKDFRRCSEEVLGVDVALQLAAPRVLSYTPDRASRANMAESEVGIGDRQGFDRRVRDREVKVWQQRHNAARRRSERTLPRPDADARPARHHVS